MKYKYLLIILNLAIYSYAQELVYSFNTIPSNYVNFNNIFLFAGSDANTGSEIWSSDGTTSGTKLIKDIFEGPSSSTNTGFRISSCQLNGKFYFFAKDVNSNGEIWETDGTNENTIKLTDFINGRSRLLTVVNQEIFFTIKVEDFKLQIWKLNTITKSSELVKEISNMWSNTSFEGEINDTFILTSQNYGSNASRLWRSNGTENGTFPITVELEGNGSGYFLGTGGTSNFSQYIKLNNKLYFVTRKDLYETDGTLENTKVTSSVWNATSSLVEKSSVIAINGVLYLSFYINNSNQSKKLAIWKSDGTTSGTSQIYLKDNGNINFFPSNLLEKNNKLLFCSSNSTGGTSLFEMNLNDYTTIEKKELMDANSATPGLTNPILYLATLLNIDSNRIFISAPTDISSYPNNGWIGDFSTNTFINYEFLNNTRSTQIFNNNLYYTFENALYKLNETLKVENTNINDFLVYPIPTRDYINIKSYSSEKINSVEILDYNGRIIKNFKENKELINVSDLINGNYILSIKTKNRVFTKKIIKN